MITPAQFAAQDTETKLNTLFGMVGDLEEAAKESQRRILTRGEVFPAQRADELVRDAWQR